MVKVEAVVVRERVETVIDAVEEETGHVGVTVVEAIGHGRERGVTHEYRGRSVNPVQRAYSSDTGGMPPKAAFQLVWSGSIQD